ncbi:MAG: 4-hydroxythreonine-4-phosphate dehydrogenase PdxA [Synechococcales cyanobacterium K44_A2020_017]|nr:4-hydroxythreonine-4-phosphate dehydrogenase PdxA [Synechococcales cyanobacterium K32_A2020_035]MBF2095564.1 4-hydroxythreonine-4-phosphate dehydrogenase PdxA [Synechococcales cyanobacterium K44_A2020_017]
MVLSRPQSDFDPSSDLASELASASATQARPPRLAIALGDPAGIGPEVVMRSLYQRPEDAVPVTVVGSRAVLVKTYDRLRDLGVPLVEPDAVSLIDVGIASADLRAVRWGVGNAASGEASFQFLSEAIDQTLAGQFDGVVTAPIAKSAWLAAGHAYPGQTELLAERAGVSRFGMMFVARSPLTGWMLRSLLATTHIPLAAVPHTLTPALMTLKLELLMDCLHHDVGLPQPRIAIAGLNPHSGEQGQLGREEVDWLQGWLDDQRQRFPQAQLDGLTPPDTLWVKPGQAWFGTRPVEAHDAYLALYHDQGLIPVKLMAFDRAVNTTIGLPFVRTSPDHGTAFDIAGQGKADATSFLAALQLGEDLARQRVKPPSSTAP